MNEIVKIATIETMRPGKRRPSPVTNGSVALHYLTLR
jgi:hypothetical protein